MKTIDEVYLVQNSILPHTMSSEVIKRPNALSESGNPQAQKTTPNIPRVVPIELELTYLHNPVVFNGINKIVQTIMSGEHLIVAKDPKVQKYFENFIYTLGTSGSATTWEELLSLIYKYQCIYGWAWIENIFNKKGNRIVDWDIIDPKKMDYAKNTIQRIALDKFGNPIGYVEELPYDYPGEANSRIPEEFREQITLPTPNSIFLSPPKIALIKMFKMGDGFYPTGLVEPLYKASLRKLNIEDALANAVWRHGFPIFLAKIGDLNHEPTPQQVNSILEKLRDASSKQELSIPYYYDLSILESKKAEKLGQHLDYFRQQEVTAMGIPAPFATGGGEATNRATLNNQSSMYMLTLKDIIDKTVSSIRKFMFEPICKLEGFKEIPTIKWDLVGSEIDEKGKRMALYVKSGVLTPEDVREYIMKLEKIGQ